VRGPRYLLLLAAPQQRGALVSCSGRCVGEPFQPIRAEGRFRPGYGD
jgi:hypothetical protein